MVRGDTNHDGERIEQMVRGDTNHDGERIKQMVRGDTNHDGSVWTWADFMDCILILKLGFGYLTDVVIFRKAK